MSKRIDCRVLNAVFAYDGELNMLEAALKVDLIQTEWNPTGRMVAILPAEVADTIEENRMAKIEAEKERKKRDRYAIGLNRCLGFLREAAAGLDPATNVSLLQNINRELERDWSKA